MNNDRLVRYNIVYMRTAAARHPVHPVRNDNNIQYTPASPTHPFRELTETGRRVFTMGV